MRYIALLRGINVGTNGRIRMDALKQLMEQAGFSRVATFIQSGNVLFDSDLPESAVREMGHPVLRALAQELTDKLRKSATINWQNRKSSRARMLAMVKVLLAKHKYPPDAQPDATDKVIAQAELLADSWAFEHP